MLAIINYKAGNLTSVKNAFDFLGIDTVVTSDYKVLQQADRIVFPGVGAAASAMENLQKMKLVAPIQELIQCGKPFLGICLGMQILFQYSEEDGGVELLNILPGKVRRFPQTPGYKIPEIGWNQVNGQTCFYFVHSYYAEVGPYTVGTTEYAGITFTSQVKKGNLMACQFHPEKSGQAGLELLRSFALC